VRLENSFEVPASPEQAWRLLVDIPRVVPCMPGAELTETIDDSNWKAKLGVKLGPISLTFGVDVSREEVDEAERRAVLSARARELRGRGGGSARIESSLAPLNGGTRVDLVTDLTLSGAVAQYGRGIVEDVSLRLVGSFADCLRAQLTAQPLEAGPQVKPVPALRLGLAALGRSIGRFVRRLAGARGLR